MWSMQRCKLATPLGNYTLRRSLETSHVHGLPGSFVRVLLGRLRGGRVSWTSLTRTYVYSNSELERLISSFKTLTSSNFSKTIF